MSPFSIHFDKDKVLSMSGLYVSYFFFKASRSYWRYDGWFFMFWKALSRMEWRRLLLIVNVNEKVSHVITNF